MAALPIAVPAGSTDVRADGPGPFITRIRYTDPAGRTVRWAAREVRKAEQQGLTWFIGVLFAVGSTCFLIGPVPWYVDAVGQKAVGATFFVGSLFFTTAAYLSYVQVVRAAGHRWFGYTPAVMGFWAAAIQLLGTLEFNVSTFLAMVGVADGSTDRLVWRPDAVGSVCFLVSSALAFAEAGHRWISWRPHDPGWRITALNLLGSVFFGVSAIGAYVLPGGSMVNEVWANAGTFAGAACFLVASLLMLPEGRR